MDAKKNHRKERKAAAAEETNKKTTTRQAHIQTAMDNPDTDKEDNHQDEDDDLNFAFMQNGQEENTMLKAQ